MRVRQYTALTAIIAVCAGLWAMSAMAGPLEDNPAWKSCLDGGGAPRACAIQVRGAGTPNSSPGTPRAFTPSGALNPAQEARVTELINGNVWVQTAYSHAIPAYHNANDARSRAINAQSTADSAMWYGQDGRSRAINAQSAGDRANNNAGYALRAAYCYSTPNFQSCISGSSWQ